MTICIATPTNAKKFLDTNWTQDGLDGTAKYQVLRSAIVGGNYYAAVKRTSVEGNEYIFAAVTKITRSRGQFCYKDMDEMMNPYYWECPKSILKLLTEPLNEDSANWREKCHVIADRKAKMVNGVKFKLKQPLTFSDGVERDTFTFNMVGRKKRYVCHKTGTVVSISGMSDREVEFI